MPYTVPPPSASGPDDDAIAGVIAAAAAALPKPDQPTREFLPHRTVHFADGFYRLTRPIDVPPGVWLACGDTTLAMDSALHYPAAIVAVNDPGVEAADRPDLSRWLDGTAKGRLGFSTAGGKFLQSQHGSHQNGRWVNRDGNEQFDYWQSPKAVVIDFAAVLGDDGPLFGHGDFWSDAAPRPWGISLRTDDKGPALNVYFADAVDLREYSPRKWSWTIRLPADYRGRLVRGTVQIDGAGGLVSAWIDRTQVAVQGKQIPRGTAPRPNDDWPLIVGLDGMMPGANSTPPTPLTLAGLMVSDAPRYNVGAVGSPQTRIDRQPVDDLRTYFTKDAGTVAYFPFLAADLDAPPSRWVKVLSGAGTPELAAVLTVKQRGSFSNRIKGATISSKGPGVLIGSGLQVEFDRCWIQAGAGPAIGTLNTIGSYPVRVNFGGLYSSDADYQACHANATLLGVDFQPGRDAVRIRGGSCEILNPFMFRAYPHTKRFAIFLPWQAGPGRLSMEGGVLDTEDRGFVDAIMVATPQPGQSVSVNISGVTSAQSGPTAAKAGLATPTTPLVLLNAPAVTSGTATAVVFDCRASGATPVSGGQGWDLSVSSPMAGTNTPATTNGGVVDRVMRAVGIRG